MVCVWSCIVRVFHRAFLEYEQDQRLTVNIGRDAASLLKVFAQVWRQRPPWCCDVVFPVFASAGQRRASQHTPSDTDSARRCRRAGAPGQGDVASEASSLSETGKSKFMDAITESELALMSALSQQPAPSKLTSPFSNCTRQVRLQQRAGQSCFQRYKRCDHSNVKLTMASLLWVTAPNVVLIFSAREE